MIDLRRLSFAQVFAPFGCFRWIVLGQIRLRFAMLSMMACLGLTQQRLKNNNSCNILASGAKAIHRTPRMPACHRE